MARDYATLSEVGLDGPWVTPLQKTSNRACELVLVAQDYLDTARAAEHREQILDGDGYCPGTKFRAVLSGALAVAERDLSRVYVTQAVHMIPRTRWTRTKSGKWRKEEVRHDADLVDWAFREVTQYEVAGRTVVAMGKVAARACRVAGFPPDGVTDHPSHRRKGRPQLIRELGAEFRRVLGLPPLEHEGGGLGPPPSSTHCDLDTPEGAGAYPALR